MNTYNTINEELSGTDSSQ